MSARAMGPVHALWCSGTNIKAFGHVLRESKVDLWAEDTLYKWVTEGPASHRDRVASEAYPDVTAHYELMRHLVDASTVSQPATWDDEAMKRWIDALVEHQYPWFVCKSWNHLSQSAISLLHEASLFHHHASNLHKLLHQGLIVDLWAAPDFMDSMSEQYRFFNRRPKGKAAKSWRREIVQQFQRYPYENRTGVTNTLKALLLGDHISLFKAFLQPEAAAMCWRASTVYLCIDYERPEMVEWVLAQRRFVPTVDEWYQFACTVHPYHLTGALRRNFRSPEKHRMLRVLFDQFDALMAPVDWLHLFVYTETTHSFVHLLAMTYKGEDLLQHVWTRVSQTAQTNIGATLCLQVDDEERQMYLTPELVRDSTNLFRAFEHLTTTKHGWTALTNALRWGTRAVVVWLLDHGATLQNTCFTGDALHTPLSLACYNSHASVLRLLLDREDPKTSLQPWFILSYKDIVAALLRHTLPASACTERFRSILEVSVSPHSYSLKTCVVRTITEHLNALQPAPEADGARATRHPPLATFEPLGPLTSYFVLHPMLHLALRLPGKVKSMACHSLLMLCHTYQQFQCMYDELRDLYGMHQLDMVYRTLVVQGGQPFSRPWSFVQHLERCPRFRHEMRCCTDSATRRIIASAWAQHSACQYDAFLRRARSDWQWYLAADVTDTTCMVRFDDVQRGQKWYNLLASGQYPLVSSRHDCDYQRTAKAFRLLRRVVRRRARQAKRAALHARGRVHWELRCALPTRKTPVRRYTSVGARQLTCAVIV